MKRSSAFTLLIFLVACAARDPTRVHWPGPEPIRPGSIDILVTPSPLHQYDKRKIVNRGTLKFAKLGEWTETLTLPSDPKEHVFYVRGRHAGWFTEIEVKTDLHGNHRRTILLRKRSDLLTKRLWINRQYVHGEDEGRHNFPRSGEPLKGFQSRFWFATVADGGGIKKTSRGSLSYEAESGRVSKDLHAGHRYILAWNTQADGKGRYRRRWLRNGTLLSEKLESVFHFSAAQNCIATPVADYCDTDLL